jgi:hypothetical protein
MSIISVISKAVSESFSTFFSDQIHRLQTSLLYNVDHTSPHLPHTFTPPNFSSFAFYHLDKVSKLLSQSPESDTNNGDFKPRVTTCLENLEKSGT